MVTMLEVKNISFSYNEDKKNIEGLSFNLEQGKMLALIGESGSGKSTILKLIYGMLEWQEGEIYYNHRKLSGMKGNLVPGEPEFKYLEQEFGLDSYATVGDNVGRFLSNIDMDEKQERIFFLLDLVEMSSFIETKCIHLSGGQKQRVALAKVLAQTPSLLLLDEPFSQVDTFKKNILKRAVFDFAKENNISILLATHEIEDALAYADEMVIIKDGKIVQKNRPSYLYKNPVNEYVARLFGEINIFTKENFPDIFKDIEATKIVVYPHQLFAEEEGELQVKVLKSYFLGNSYLVEAIGQRKRIWFSSEDYYAIGESCMLQIHDYQILRE